MNERDKEHTGSNTAYINNEAEASPKISVVIPAYNSAATVEKAVRSVLNQTYRNTEVIVVDDGSSDDTAGIVRRLAEEDRRVMLISVENGGVSSARNIGLRMVSGKYFATLDADDYYDPEMFARMCDAAECYDTDMLICGFRLVFDNGRRESFRSEQELFTDREGFIDTLLVELYDRHMISTHSNKLYRTSIVQEQRVYYDEALAVNEDIDFVLRFMKECSVIGVIKGVYLNYLQHGAGGSLINTFRPYGVSSSLKILRDCNELFDGLELSDETLTGMDNRLFVHICSFAGLMYSMSSYSERRILAELEGLLEDEDFQELLYYLKPDCLKTRIARRLLMDGRLQAYHKMCCLMYRTDFRERNAADSVSGTGVCSRAAAGNAGAGGGGDSRSLGKADPGSMRTPERALSPECIAEEERNELPENDYAEETVTDGTVSFEEKEYEITEDMLMAQAHALEKYDYY